VIFPNLGLPGKVGYRTGGSKNSHSPTRRETVALISGIDDLHSAGGHPIGAQDLVAAYISIKNPRTPAFQLQVSGSRYLRCGLRCRGVAGREVNRSF